jgi:outer membrane protein OmpA-like peptidoglycan-associated protein
MTVVGHTDATGSESYNQQLSERRAEAVRAELIRDGVPAARLDAMGRGEVEPRADNGTVTGRAQNRRVEILVQSTA